MTLHARICLWFKSLRVNAREAALVARIDALEDGLGARISGLEAALAAVYYNTNQSPVAITPYPISPPIPAANGPT